MSCEACNGTGGQVDKLLTCPKCYGTGKQVLFNPIRIVQPRQKEPK